MRMTYKYAHDIMINESGKLVCEGDKLFHNTNISLCAKSSAEMRENMKVRLREMSLQEFETFREYSTNDYAKDLMKEQNISPESALKQAVTEFSDMLPEGIKTKDHSLMMIEDENSQKTVGIIWYLYEITEGTKQVFLNDLLIYEQERRKGYAMAALSEMVHNAARAGCRQSIIYVWKHNPPGVNLYTKCGYVAFR